MTNTARNDMHDYQTIDPRAFRNTLGLFPTGITIITTRATRGTCEDIGMTMNSFSAVSLEPPLVSFCVDRHAISLPVWRDAQAFGVNILGEGQSDVSNQFAKARGDKWSGVDIRRGLGDVALIEGAIVHLECIPYAQYDGGDHIIFVVQVSHYETAVSPHPLVFFQGRYNHTQPGPVAPPDWPLPIHY